MLCEADSQIAALLEAETPVVTIVGKSWDLHVHHVLETTLEENLAMIGESVRYLHKQHRRVFYDAEHFFDGYKANREYTLATIGAAAAAGAEFVILCETNGGALPWEVRDRPQGGRLPNEHAASARWPHGAGRIHTHDDGGLGTANTLPRCALA